MTKRQQIALVMLGFAVAILAAGMAMNILEPEGFLQP